MNMRQVTIIGIVVAIIGFIVMYQDEIVGLFGALGN
jgi:hypothetical protein